MLPFLPKSVRNLQKCLTFFAKNMNPLDFICTCTRRLNKWLINVFVKLSGISALNNKAQSSIENRKHSYLIIMMLLSYYRNRPLFPAGGGTYANTSYMLDVLNHLALEMNNIDIETEQNR